MWQNIKLHAVILYKDFHSKNLPDLISSGFTFRMCFLIFFLYFANGCTRNELNNTCDPSSDGFTKSLFVKAVSKDKSPQCGINYFSNSGNNGSGVVNIPDAPTGVFVAGGDTKSTVSWSNVSGATSYNIYWSTTAGVTVTTGTKIPNVGSSPYDHLG
ncbi:MAG: hypothetical protein K8R21_16030, partial [Leptospira sp.]|nr:hypothetical protein [Leptospira sp.]